MSMRINDIFLQKLNEIQSRVPLKINIPEKNTSFQDMLDDALSSDSIGQEGLNRSSEYERAKASLAATSAVIPKSKTRLMELINENVSSASKKYGVDPSLIRAVIKQESDFEPLSLSNAGAQGLMQLMPGTAQILKVKDPWDIAQNIDGGTHFLKDQLTSFNGDLKLALAAYNAGPDNVHKYRGIPPFSETKNYVTNVLQYYQQYTSGK